MQLRDFAVVYRLEVGQIGQFPDAVSRHPEARRVVPGYRHYPHSLDLERLRRVDFVQRDFRHSAVFVLRECVVEILAHHGRRSRCRVDVDPVYRRRVVHEVERPHVVQPARVVLVFVGQQDGIYAAHARAEHLGTEVRARVDDQPFAPGLDHRRGPQAVVARVFRPAYRAAAPDNRHPLRGSCAQECQFHSCKDKDKDG